jgi:AcrR family transcriptional regulator
MPRKYTMTRRAEALQETRARIVDATVAAHRELGIKATSWDEIARRAEVGIGTVYRHFRSLDELLPACGEVVTQTLALPAGDEIPGLFQGARSVEGRIRRLVSEVFAGYERGAPFVENVRRERKDLPDLERWHTLIEGTLEALTREALRPLKPDQHSLDVTRALIDLYAWKAFKNRGLSPDQTVETVCRLIASALAKQGKGRSVR